jgi:hypothetical protein
MLRHPGELGESGACHSPRVGDRHDRRDASAGAAFLVFGRLIADGTGLL